ncbi:hypothetical protein BDQ17DRAFT_1364151 [Cyathus striatus]|nr:hypothetical protein BDQ17DRAFT_1364151 [Cyathus striatus]
MSRREKYEALFPARLPITQLPLVHRQLTPNERAKVPGYVAGWIIKTWEIREKWDPEDSWNSVTDIDDILRRKWIKYQWKDKTDPLLNYPLHKGLDGYNILFIFLFNNSQKDMETFLTRKDAIFEQMCDFFEFQSPEERKRMYNRFMWYRLRVFESDTLRDDDVYPDVDCKEEDKVDGE